MKYKDFEGSIEELVGLKLDEIEKAKEVKILYAVESGSRAWGFASPDSDYDVRFIYVHKKDYYLGLEEEKDIIDWELDETLDINGWDLKKALRLFYKSNTALFEWANSPVVYRTTKEWEGIYQISQTYFCKKNAMYHYYGTANHNFHEYLQGELVNYKKYLYVLRPLLACKWIEDKNCPPPVLFHTLAEEILDCEIKVLVDKLLAEKSKMKEADKGKRMERLNQYMEQQLLYYKDYINGMDRNQERSYQQLNRVFIENLL